MDHDQRAVQYTQMGLMPDGVTFQDLGTTTPECNGIPIKWSKTEVTDLEQFTDWENRLQRILDGRTN